MPRRLQPLEIPLDPRVEPEFRPLHLRVGVVESKDELSLVPLHVLIAQERWPRVAEMDGAVRVRGEPHDNPVPRQFYVREALPLRPLLCRVAAEPLKLRLL